MRWTRRDAGHKPSAAPIIEDVPFFIKGQRPDSHLPASIPGNSIDQLQKAERVLGISQRQSSLVTPNNARQRASQPVVSAQEPVGDDQWGSHTQQEYQPMDNARSANGGLKPWPSLQSTNNHVSTHDMRAADGGRALPAHFTSSTTAHHHRQDPRELAYSTLHSHHEASQQNSASAAHEMGLRKVPSGASSNRNAVETSGRPLKSALKHPGHEPELTEKPVHKKEGWKFGNIFPKHHHSNRSHLQPSQLSRNGSSLSVASTAQSFARAPSSAHSNEALASSAPGSASIDSAKRPKVFENDVFDSAKVNVRRPPKGIQNWFDGVDISSDEEDQQANEALPSTFSPYQENTYHAVSQNTHMHNGASRKESYSSNSQQEARSHRSSRQPSRPMEHLERNISDTFIEENAMAIDLARQRMQGLQKQQNKVPRSRRDSGDSYAPSSLSHSQSIMSGTHHGSSEYSSMKRDVGNRTWRTRVPAESVMSMSVYSQDVGPSVPTREGVGASSHFTANASEASPAGAPRSSIASRPCMVRRSNTRDTVMTTQTSGSIPIHWSNDEPMPALPPRAPEENEVDHTSEALRRLVGRDSSVRDRFSRAVSSKYTYEDSLGGETNDSAPSDISRMMAVTEEEMALLEMMRLKRAAMQKGEISEGAQQILKREQEQLAEKQIAAQNSAQNLAKAKEERQTRPPGEWAYDLRPDYERIAGLGSLLESDVDEKLRIERFLASETPLEEVFPFPSPPIRSPYEPLQMDDLLLPRTYTPQPPEPQTQRGQHKGALGASSLPNALSGASSALSARSGASEFDADESAQLEAEMRQFLGDEEVSESSAFPLPPKSSSSNRRASRRGVRGLRAPKLPPTREEESTPPIPIRSPNRMHAFNDESVLPPSDRAMHMRADSDALVRSFPPTIATQFARPPVRCVPEPPSPSDAPERLSAFLGPNFEHSLDMTFPTSASTNTSQNSNSRYDSPSISTSQVSPLTPTFPTPLTNEKHRGVEIASNDVGSGYLHTYDGADQNSMRTVSSSHSGAHSHLPSRNRPGKALAPAPLDMLAPSTYSGTSRTPSRVSSNGSCMSASDDVLAAWAELGGVSDGLPIRSRSPMRPR
ncbi:hypothetical protein MBLNU13_g11562t1 [Cladosporium sp. NU13]